MKNKNFLKAGFALLLACMISTGVYAQVAVVGTLKDGKASVTSLADATAVLKGGLSASATVTDISIQLEPASGKYYLFGAISNDRITGKAVELQNEAGILRAASGPGIEITCTGYKCGRCVPNINKLKVRCVCEDANPSADTHCDMISKVVITAW
ncbi:MAG: hypothetical protein IPL92_02905 [Saprospiraceae bacterium]|nr:hypothetical protein [Candidatus Opimibacter iunctus]